MNIIRQAAFLRSLNMSLFFTSSKLIIFLTILVFVLSGNTLTAGQVGYARFARKSVQSLFKMCAKNSGYNHFVEKKFQFLHTIYLLLAPSVLGAINFLRFYTC